MSKPGSRRKAADGPAGNRRVIWAVWPFSRLVHAWSYPLWSLWRPSIVYRSRRPVPPAEPGTSGRRWRKIGVPC